MSQAASPSTGQVYGVKMVCEALSWQRSSFYSSQAAGPRLLANLAPSRNGLMRSYWISSGATLPTHPLEAKVTARYGPGLGF